MLRTNQVKKTPQRVQRVKPSTTQHNLSQRRQSQHIKAHHHQQQQPYHHHQTTEQHLWNWVFDVLWT